MYASATVLFSVVLGVDGASLDAPHGGVISEGVFGASWTLHHALPGRVVSVGVILHGTDLHAQPGDVVCEVGGVAA